MKYITKYITNHNTNRDLEMKIRTFTEIGSYMLARKQAIIVKCHTVFH